MLKIAYFLRKLQTSRANNPRIFSINNAKISGYGSYMNTNIEEDFQICISVPLKCRYFPQEIIKPLDMGYRSSLAWLQKFGTL